MLSPPTLPCFFHRPSLHDEAEWHSQAKVARGYAEKARLRLEEGKPEEAREYLLLTDRKLTLLSSSALSPNLSAFWEELAALVRQLFLLVDLEEEEGTL